MNVLKHCRWQFHTKTLCSRLFKGSAILYWIRPFCNWGLRGNVRWSSYAHRKHVVDFLLVLIELFSLGITAEALCHYEQIMVQNWRFCSFAGAGWPKFAVRRGRPTSHFSSQKTRLNGLVWYKHLYRSFFHFVTIHAFADGQTDSFLLTRPSCIQCGAVKQLYADSMYLQFPPLHPID